MKIWVSGGSGYIGINLRKLLQDRGIDHFNYDATLNYDIIDERTIYQTMKGCDAVIHLAACPGITYCERNIVEAVETNILGTNNVVQAASILKIPLVFSSTFAAKTGHNIYGVTKRLAEILVLMKDGVVLRLANVYGGIAYLTRKKSALSSFVAHKKAGLSAEIFGDGSATRDFVHVRDVCEAMLMAVGAPMGVYEICTGHQTSIKDAADMIGVEYELSPPRRGDIDAILADADFGVLGWEHKIKLEDGIKELLET